MFVNDYRAALQAGIRGEQVRHAEALAEAEARGRAVFNQMVKLLRHGKADGVIIHKIDRSARNMKDWAELGELIDQGVRWQP